MESAIQKRQPMKIDIGAVFNFSVSRSTHMQCLHMRQGQTGLQ